MPHNSKLKCVCPHFAISTKLADLRHTYKSLRKLLRKEVKVQNYQTLRKISHLQKAQIGGRIALKIG